MKIAASRLRFNSFVLNIFPLKDLFQEVASAPTFAHRIDDTPTSAIRIAHIYLRMGDEGMPRWRSPSNYLPRNKFARHGAALRFGAPSALRNK